MLPFKINIDYLRSHGSYVFDINTGKKYLDMVNHYSSNALGYFHRAFSSKSFQDEILAVAGIKTAVGIYGSNEYDQFLAEFKEFACPPGFNQVHFACTGSLAVEAAIKAAWFHQIRKMEEEVYPKNIIAIKNGFHGINSFGNFLSDSNRVQKYITVTEKTQIDVLPVCEIWPLSEFSSDYLAVNLFNSAAAVIVEPVQCTAGDVYLGIEFLKKLRQSCTKAKIPLIFDEIQTGFGTTGKVWYWQHIGVEPDIIVFGKKAQVSGIMVKDEFAGIFNEYDKLSVTFDGDLIDMIRCKYIIREIKNSQLLQNITAVGNELKVLIDRNLETQNIRGIGGLIAFDLASGQERDEFVKRAFENGLLCNPTADRSVRLRPNLATTIREVEECAAIINSTIDKLYL